MASAPMRLIFPIKKFVFNHKISGKEVYRRYAGHSKWANIKHIKAVKDSERSLLFTKISRLMRVAIAEGGPAPESNILLTRAIEQAKKLNMPQGSIQNILKSTVKEQTVPKKQHLVEVKGPGGFMILIEVLTSNWTKTKADFSVFLRKSQSSVSEGVKSLFERKGIIQAISLKSYPLDKVIENAIEGGADDVSETEGDDGKVIFQFFSEPDVMHSLKVYLESRDYSVYFASIEYLPLNVIELNEENAKLALKLLEKLNDHPDVVGVYDNFS